MRVKETDLFTERAPLFTKFGTTTPDGRRAFKEIQDLLRPILDNLCNTYVPHEVGLVCTTVVSLETSSYGAALFHAHMKNKKKLGG